MCEFDRNCVSMSKVCDGEGNCWDFSDEQECGKGLANNYREGEATKRVVEMVSAMQKGGGAQKVLRYFNGGISTIST